MRHRVSIERRVADEDALGQPLDIWELDAAVWADVHHKSGLAAIKGDADVSIVQASIRIRHRAGIDAGMRVTHDGQQYDIKAVLPDGKRQYLDLVCQAVQ